MTSKHPRGYWTEERVTDEAKKYVSKNQFRENVRAAYVAAKKYGILDMLFIPQDKIVHKAGFWTHRRLVEEAKKYKTKGEFKKQSPSAYATARRLGLLASMDWFINGRHKKRGPYKEHKYSKDIISEIIREHNCITVTDLRKENEYAYKEARDNNWLTDLGLAENKHEDGYWTPERVWDVAKLYTNKKEFGKNEPVA